LKRLYAIIFLSLAVLSPSFPQQVEASKIFDIHFKQDFEHNTLGTYNYEEWEEDWNYPEFGTRVDETQIIQSTDQEQNSKVMHWTFPEGSVYGDGGGHWKAPLDGVYEELYFSYRLRFKPGFQCAKGGKLPGVVGRPDWGGGGKPAYDEGFRGKLMWDTWQIIAYMYYHNMTHEDWGDAFTFGKGLGVDDTRWLTFTTRVVMNTFSGNTPNADGIFEVFYDSILYFQKTDIIYREVEGIGVDMLEIVSFFGGDPTPEYAATRDEWIDFDDFYAFTYKPDVDVPRGNLPSMSDRKLYLPYYEFSDAAWRKSITANAVSSKTVYLEWKKYFYPVSYTIQRKEESDTVFQDVAVVDFANTSFKNSNLLPNTTYYYRIQTANSISDTVAVTTQSPAPPLAPTSLVSLLTAKKEARIGWKDNSVNELAFIIERSDVTSDNYRQIAEVNSNVKEFTNTSLTPVTSYYYRVKAYNEDGESDYSNVLSITTLQLQLPAAPTSLSAGGITKNSCTLSWKDNADNESGFQIFVLEESTDNFKLSQTAAANKIQLSMANLQPNTSYTFKVRAYNEDGVSAFTNEIKLTTLPLQPPVAPITLIYDTITPSSAYLRWTDKSDNESGFQIYRSLAETTGFQLIHTNSSNQNTYISNNLNQATSYFYRVRAYNDDGVSAYTNTLKIITPNPPRSPTNLILKSETKTSVSFEWTDNSDNEAGFYIERSVSTPGQFVRIDTLKADTKEFTDQNLKNSTSYYYRLAAFNIEGSSAYSDTLVAHTYPMILPAAPSALEIDSITPFSVTIVWNDNSSNETGFQIQRADQSSAFANIANITSGIALYYDTDLQQNSVYYYRVRAYNSDGYSVFTDTLTIQTPENIIPPIPDNFVTDLIRYNKVVLSWTVNTTHISGFQIERATGAAGNYEIIAKTKVVSTYTDTTVAQGTDYTYRIRSFNDYNYSLYSLIADASVPFLVLPEPPELLSPAEIESNIIAIKWADKSTDESGFIVKRALYPQTDFKALYTTGPDDTLFIDKTVLPNTTYCYMVNSVNEKGQSDNSNQLRVSSLSLAEAARFREGLIAYYNFSLNGDTIIHDLSGYSSPVDLLITDTTSVSWTRNSRFEIISNTMVHSQHAAAKIVNACKKTNEITLECWVKPTMNDNNGDATIVSLSHDPENIGISLMQSDYSFSENKNYRYLLGLSTKSTESSGRPYLATDENDIITMHHIAYTRNNLGEEKLYLNGEMVTYSMKPLGLENWKDDYYLYLGNESTMEKPWKGMYYLMAIYNVALTADQISQNYLAGPTDNINAPENAFEIKLFPNPSTGRVNFDIKPTEFNDYGEKVVLQLIDINGLVHFEEVIHDSNQHYLKEFDLSNLKKGVYYLRLISTTGSTTQKIIIY
jgi:hypothetical protein